MLIVFTPKIQGFVRVNVETVGHLFKKLKGQGGSSFGSQTGDRFYGQRGAKKSQNIPVTICCLFATATCVWVQRVNSITFYDFGVAKLSLD